MNAQSRTHSEKSKVSCIICHHTGDMILKTLRSIPKECETIVVTSERGRYFKEATRTVHVSLNNPAYKRNVGEKWAEGKYIAFLDDDVELQEGCLEALVDFIRPRQACGIAYATLFDAKGNCNGAGGFISWCGFIVEESEPLSTMVFAGKSAVCMMRKEDFIGFDEDFFIYGEESDLSWRLWLIGKPSYIVKEAKAYHYTDKPVGYYIKRNIHFHGCKNYLSMLIKNVGPSHWTLPVFNACTWNLVAFAFLFRNPKVSLWIWEAQWWVIKNWKTLMFKRYHIQSTRRLADRDLYYCIYKNGDFAYYKNRLRDYLKHQLHHGRVNERQDCCAV